MAKLWSPYFTPHPHPKPPFEKASVLLLGWLASSEKVSDRIFLFAQQQGCLSISTASGGGLSGLLITMFSPVSIPSLMVCYTSKWESRLGLSGKSSSSSLQFYATPCKQDWLSLLFTAEWLMCENGRLKRETEGKKSIENGFCTINTHQQHRLAGVTTLRTYLWSV